MTATIEPPVPVEVPSTLYDPAATALLLPPADRGVPIADPAPLGLAAFAGTTFVLSLFNAGLVGTPALVAVVLPFALIFGGLAQLLAGMWEFRNDNTFGAVAFTSYGAFWISYFVYAKYIAATLPPADAHVATGIFLLTWTIFTCYMTVAALRTNVALIAIFGTVLVTFALLTIGEFAESSTVLHLGGFVGLAAAVCAWYGSAAGVVNSTWGRTVLPVRPIAR
ncbi:MAG: acetate uptake transporter [Nocardioidaceae bacterium]